MKKLPIALSILSVFGMAAPVSAFETEEDSIYVLDIVPYTDSRVKIGKFTPETGSVNVDLLAHTDDDWAASEIYFATYDYKSGISLAKANELAAALGETGQESWMANYYRHTVDWDDFNFEEGERPQHLGVMIENGANLYKSSPTDILYYAVKYENWVDSTMEPEWIRGSINYRECIHGPYFTSGGNQACILAKTWSVMAGAYEEYYTREYYGRTYKEILSWGGELKMLLEEELAKIEGEIASLEELWEDYAKITEEQTDEVTTALEEFEALVTGLEKEEMFVEEIEAKEGRIETLKTPKVKPIEDGDEDGEEEEDKETTEKPVTPTKPTEPSGSGSTGSTELGATDGADQNAYERPVGGDSSDEKSETQLDSSASVSGAVVANNGLSGQNNGGVGGVSAGSAQGGADEDDEAADEEDEELEETEEEFDETEVEVPNLGREEVNKDNVWWLLAVILGVGTLGFVGWWIRRAFFAKGTKTER